MAKLTVTKEMSVSPKVKSILFPVSLLVALLVLSMFAYRLLSEKLSDQSKRLNVARKNENVLREKQELLKGLTFESNLLRDTSLLGVPARDSGLMLIGQLKRLAGEYFVGMTDLRIGPLIKDSGGLNSRQVSFDFNGSFSEVLAFFLDMKNISPLTTVEKVDLIQTGGFVSGGITLRVYSASFPEKLPSLTEPLKDFTTEEREILTTLSELAPPSFSEISPEAPVIRADPFE